MKRMISRKAALLISLVTLVFASSITTASAAKKTTPKKDATLPTLVNVTTAKTIEWQPDIESTGTLVADQGITVKSDTAGRITRIYFKSGQYVKKGTPLIQLYSDILKVQLREDLANLKLTSDTWNRYSKLFNKNAVSSSDYETAQANFNKAKAAAEKTQAQLDQKLIKAPFNGYLGIRKVSLGDYLSTGQAIVNLEDTDPLFVDFTVPEIYSKKIKTGQKIIISSATYDNQLYTGKIIAHDSLINPNTRTLQIRASIPNPNNTLIPGSFVMTKIYVGEKISVVSLPQIALTYSQAGTFIFKVVNGKAVKTFVSLGYRGVSDINITKGIKSGDLVVIAGQQKLYDGSAIQIKK